MDATNLKRGNYFLQGGGEMAARTRDHDWSQSPLGTPDQWAQSLRTTLGILLNAAFPMFLFWGEELICFYNDAYRSSLGNEGRHPAVGKRGREVWPEIWEFIGPLILQVRSTGQAVWFEDQLIPFHRNGRLEDIYWTFSYSPVLDDEGGISGVLVTCMETTKTVSASRLLEESRQDLAFAIEAAELATWDYDPVSNRFTADARYTEWFGLTAAEATDNDLSVNIIAAEDRERVRAAMSRTLSGPDHDRFDIEYTIRPHNLPERILRAKGKAWYREDGRAYRLTGTLQDITGHVLSRKKVAESENNLRNLILHAPVAMCIFRGPEYIVEIVNERMLESWGKTEEEVLNKPVYEALPEARGQGYEDFLYQVYTTGEPFTAFGAPATLTRNGVKETRYVNLVYEALREGDGTISGIIIVNTDVTEQELARRKVEESEAELQRRVAERTSELERMNIELKRSNAQLEEFAHAASHDLKEPTRKIHILTDRLKQQLRDKLSRADEELFERVEHASARMSTLIEDMLIFSQVSERPREKEAVDLREKIYRILEDLELEIEAKGALITVDDLPVVQGHRRQLQQLFQNLLTNSLKYSRADESPRIRISSGLVSGSEAGLIPGNRYHSITVSDNGIGFDQAYAERIFQMFQRLHAKDSFAGTGIGLAIARKVAENHEGRITAQSEPGKGARFTVYLPA